MSYEGPSCLRERIVGRTTVVELRGEMDLLTAPVISAYLDSLTAAPEPDVVIDLQYLSFIDCSGLSVLCRARSRVRERGGRLALVLNNPQVHRTIRLAGLLRFFDVLDSGPRAVRDSGDTVG